MSLNEQKKKSQLAISEEKILEFWKENNIFEKTLEKESPKGEFIFYEGPPTANAGPAIHHLEARAFKDVIPRYKTMRGFHVSRKGGWDTHGLPVELQVEKKLGLKSKKEIESYGIEEFNKKCKESVWEYVDLWEKFTDRIGYWVDMKNPYVTYEKTYMESVWNILKTVSEKKFLYKDYKVVPWCPRCGTALSSHELAQGYEEVKDLSVFVKFKVRNPEKHKLPINTSLLAWTTTPWTLPGNIALAVGEKIEYKILSANFGNGDETLIFAETDMVNRVLAGQYNNINGSEKIKGSDLVGLEYEPLYSYLTEKFSTKDPEAFKKAFKVYLADFVTTEDGTGIVHTAVMYGQDDFELGTKIGLPKFHLVNENGNFIEGMNFLSGRFVRDEETAVEIIKDLAHRGLLLKKEKYAHSYPHCWRCKTPLIYYARDSWYIRMSDLRNKLVKENESINWEPEHIKEGRFGEWLREVKDWAISRERYWGTPLPIWENEEGKKIVIGSVSELKERIPKRNNYFLIRHGQSEGNVGTDLISSDPNNKNSLTEKGREQTRKAAKSLKKQHIDVIISSPFERVKQTAQILKEELGFSGEIIVDPRIGEIQVGEWNGKSWTEFESKFKNLKERFTEHFGAPENWEDARKRVSEFMYDIDKKYEGKKILIVGHGGPLNLIRLASEGYSVSEMAEHYYDNPFDNDEIQEIDWRNLPHNDKFEIDLHRPYIDSVVLYENDKPFKRVKEVLDVWLDSGAMPFAQHHYPFGFKKSFFGKDNLPYPADYISEAIDQTRGWFYTLHAIGVLMGKGKAYKNVICLGHILDAEGKKMSKSVGNVVDPWMMMDKYSADALRLWMYTVNQPGDSKNFDERTVDEVVKKVFNLASNIITFYELYADTSVLPSNESPHVLDRWIVARLNQLIEEGSRSLDNFKIFESARAVRDFVGDFSTWYIRRSRDRFKSEDLEDKKNALATTRFVLKELSKYMAPFTPFFAEFVYEKVRLESDPLSVHLEDWPEIKKPDQKILTEMAEVRNVVSLALELRARSGIKIRQPLQTIKIQETRFKRQELSELVSDEVNVKEVVVDENMKDKVWLDINITEELKEEGNLRELIRMIQDLRKKENLNPGDLVKLFVSTDSNGKNFIEKFNSEIKRTAQLSGVEFSDQEGEGIKIDNLSFKLKIQK